MSRILVRHFFIPTYTVHLYVYVVKKNYPMKIGHFRGKTRRVHFAYRPVLNIFLSRGVLFDNLEPFVFLCLRLSKSKILFLRHDSNFEKKILRKKFLNYFLFRKRSKMFKMTPLELVI